jgi:hypothetical protein
LFVVIATTGKLDTLIPHIPKTENRTSLVNMTLADQPGSFLDILTRLGKTQWKNKPNLRWFSTMYSHVKTGGAMHGIHLIYRDLDQQIAKTIDDVTLVPKLDI